MSTRREKKIEERERDTVSDIVLEQLCKAFPRMEECVWL
jgi:hypothetical protein